MLRLSAYVLEENAGVTVSTRSVFNWSFETVAAAGEIERPKQFSCELCMELLSRRKYSSLDVTSWRACAIKVVLMNRLKTCPRTVYDSYWKDSFYFSWITYSVSGLVKTRFETLRTSSFVSWRTRSPIHRRWRWELGAPGLHSAGQGNPEMLRLWSFTVCLPSVVVRVADNKLATALTAAVRRHQRNADIATSRATVCIACLQFFKYSSFVTGCSRIRSKFLSA